MTEHVFTLIRFTATLTVAALLFNNLAFAAGPVDAAAMRAKVQARGVGQGVRVTLADQAEVKGLIVSISEQSFTVKPRGSDQAREIEFVNLKGVHNDRMSTGEKVGITVGIVGAVVLITALVFDHLFKSSFPKTIPI
jgi:hypothetical protein